MSRKRIDSFEGNHIPYHGISELTCPEGWMPAWADSSVRPEIKPKDKELGQPEVFDGVKATSIHTRHKAHDAVLKRRFDVAPGLVTVRVWCMNQLDGEGRKAGHGMVLGISEIDVGNNLDSKVIYWSDWWAQDMPADGPVWEARKWAQLSVSRLIEADHVWVYLRSKSRYDRDSFAHFDLFEIEDTDTPGTSIIDLLDRCLVLLEEAKDLVLT